MEILTWLTVIYLVVLVAVLAVGLILILIALRSVGSKLAQISAGLKVVDGNTAPLNAGGVTRCAGPPCRGRADRGSRRSPAPAG